MQGPLVATTASLSCRLWSMRRACGSSPISVLPKGLAIFAKILPGTHALALMRHGLTGGPADGLTAIWGVHAGTTSEFASFAIVVVFTAGLLLMSARVFRRSAVA